ncbi:MAG: DUF1186 domain-containing protein [Verrucomicrobia bacterium]|nr:DUF1186 domain-containing protein [Verrucomicrobiota bacterium]
MVPGHAPTHPGISTLQPGLFQWALTEWLQQHHHAGIHEHRSGWVLLRVVTDAFHEAAEPAATASEATLWTPDRIEEILSVTGDPMRRPALAAADQCRESLTPRLLAELERWIQTPDAAAEDDGALGIHALHLLASWRSEEATDVFERLYGLDDATAEALIGPARMFAGPWLLASVLRRAPERLIALARNVQASEGHRAAVFEALSLLVTWKELDRSDLLEMVRGLFDGGLTPRRHGLEWYGLISLVLQQSLDEFGPRAEHAIQNGCVDPVMMNLRDFRAILRAGPPPPAQESEPEYSQRRDLAEITGWLDDDPDNPNPDPDPQVSPRSAPPSDPKPFVAPERPGRNDPCPCGSGRKFKKCCGA